MITTVLIWGGAILVLLGIFLIEGVGARERGTKTPAVDRVFVDLDVLRQIESGGNPDARSMAGARGPYQLMEPAWIDAVRSLREHGFHGAEAIGDYGQYVCDETISRVVAHEYMNHVLPGYLTARRLSADDRTGPVPDSLDARLAAWNAGAMAVRRAHEKSGANWIAYVPFETREFISRYHREVTKRQLRAKFAQAKSQ